jgi:hypothetical protein
MPKNQSNQRLLSVVTPETAEIGLQPPRPLGEPGQKLWNRVQSEYRVTDAGGVEILYQACVACDRAEELAAVIAAEGSMVQTKSTRKVHPAIKQELELRAFINRALNQLGLAVEPLRSVGRPPQAYGGPFYR